LEGENEETEEEIITSGGQRLNALTLTGLPISCLKTQSLFAYSAHFDSAPTGLEWINDWTVVFVYPATKAAKTALRNLRKLHAEDPDEEEFFTAKPIPVNLWPPGSRIQISLGSALDDETRDMKQRISIRIARCTDVKEKGARTASEFYRKHGDRAGKEMYEFPDQNPQPRKKRQKEDLEGSDHVKRARLDEELDALHSQDSTEDVGGNEKVPTQTLRTRILEHTDGRQGFGRSKFRGPKPTKQNLDDELDAFLSERN